MTKNNSKGGSGNQQRSIRLEILTKDREEAGRRVRVQATVLQGGHVLEGEGITLLHNGQDAGFTQLDENNQAVWTLTVSDGEQSFQAVDAFIHSPIRRLEAEKPSAPSMVPHAMSVAAERFSEGVYELIATLTKEDGSPASRVAVRLFDSAVEEGWRDETTDELGWVRFRVVVAEQSKDITILVPGQKVGPWRTRLFRQQEIATPKGE